MRRTFAALLCVMISSGCASYQAYQARFGRPDYTVTPEYFSRSPRRVAVLPFAARLRTDAGLERAQICRLAFYQHFSVRDFEDVELEKLDRRLLPEEKAQAHRRLSQFADTLRWLDVVGLTSVLDLEPVLNQKARDTATFRDWTKTAYEGLQADAYVLGLTRGYGRFYAVLFSSIGLATHVEMRSTADDTLLWSTDHRARNVALPLTMDPLGAPKVLYDIWRNSRGAALDLLAYRVYRDVLRTLPAERAAGAVYVRADRPKTRIFQRPTVWAFWPKPAVKKGTRMKFLLDHRGWYQCKREDGQVVWILRSQGTLVDRKGNLLERTDPVAALWKNGD